jgi:asparagine N-glycosylation enzyme membrane subunit Stt3
MIGKLIYSRLSTDGAILPYVGSKIYPDIVPQNVQYPFVVYTITNSTPVDYKDGQSNLEEIEIQIDVYTQNYDDTQDLANLIRNRLDRFVGTVEGVEVQSIKYTASDSQVYNAELSVYWMSVDFLAKMKR